MRTITIISISSSIPPIIPNVIPAVNLGSDKSLTEAVLIQTAVIMTQMSIDANTMPHSISEVI